MENKNTTPLLSLIIPVFKQERTIIKNLKMIKKVLDNIRYDYEIIVVIDGIVDKSFEKIKKSKLNKITCLAYQKNQGKSFAIRLGMNYSKGDYLMFIDSGMEIDPNGISMLIEHMEWYSADIIVGSKRHPASIINYPFHRKLLSLGYYFLVKLLFGVKIRDTQAGIKIFKKEVLQKIVTRLVEKRFAGDLEMLAVADVLGYKRIFEAPIKLNYPAGAITFAASLSSIWNIFIDTLAIFYRKNILNYYKKPHRKLIRPKDTKIIYLTH